MARTIIGGGRTKRRYGGHRDADVKTYEQEVRSEQNEDGRTYAKATCRINGGDEGRS